ncbi:MAG: cellulase family glycosylhydrolase [Verrucomicrobiia bacterium]|jgi:hypothetical protein
MKNLSYAATLFVFLSLVSPVSAQRWESRGKEFILAVAGNEIVYRAPGTVAVRRAGGPEVRLSITLWHDAWIHERLDAGKIESGPEVDRKGWLRQSGTWVIREGAAPMRYTLALEPTAKGAVLHLETEKTAPLSLTAGLWATISFDRKAFAGRRLFARPVAHGKVGGNVSGDCEALLVELGDGRAVAFAGEGFRELRCRVNETTQGFEMNLRPGDFPVGKKVVTLLKIGFDTLPEKFAGDIEPHREPLAIGKVSATSATVPRFGKLELSVDLRGTWENPFDPDQVALDATVTTASGRQFTQPGFFMVDYRREVRDGVEVMSPVGEGRWCVRVACVEPGPLRVKLTAKDRSGSVSKDAGEFAVKASAGKGFLRQSRVDPHYLQFDSGVSFVPIGHNLPGYHTAGQTGPDAIRKMAAKGENYNRWWMSSSSLGIEWEDRLGWYRQAQAARLDSLLNLAAELDFYYMLCMDTHQDFREGGWRANPFNKANGGPCEKVSEWFTGEPSRSLYKKRLRYTVARWGYSPQILCWEFGNEFEGWADTTEETKNAWHREMSDYLAALDPYRHLITTSWWGKTGPEACWRIPRMDIVQTHCYTNNDGNVAEQVRRYCLEQWTNFAKPHIFGEFGIRSHSSTADKDPKGWGLHNANWAALCSGCCGIPMPWWHENYIEPLNLYFHFTAIANFAKGLPFGTTRWEQVSVAATEYVDPPASPITRDIVLSPVSKWGKPAASEFRIQRDGTVNDPAEIRELLHGMGHHDLINPPTFVVEFPRAGKFIITVGRVSRSGLLRVWVDGEQKLNREFPCGEKIGKQWIYQPKWKLWESVYDEDVAVDVPAGKHRIRVDNLGGDWMRITRYAFTGCKVLDRPNLLVAALRAVGGPRIVWMQNQDSDWFNHQKSAVPPVPPSRITLDGFADGTYAVEWWETWKGKPVRTEKATAHAGKLTLLPGELKTDLAAKIRPQ